MAERPDVLRPKSPSILLIHPPVAKPSEPPAGITRLAGMLGSHGVRFTVLDANLEGLLLLLRSSRRPAGREDRWTRRAFTGCDRNIEGLKDFAFYKVFDRYKRAVADLGRVLEISSARFRSCAGLANYRQEALSPLRSSDLIAAAERPEANPFYGYFSGRIAEMMEKFRPDFIGLSLNYLSQALCSFAMLGYLKKEFPELRIVIGGGLVTSWLRGTAWHNPFAGLVDYFVAGPGEKQLASILGIDIQRDSCYTPDYSAVARNEYLSPGFILPYSASAGCYWNKCNFCPEKAEGNIYSPLPPVKVISDLQHLRERTQPSLIHFLDSALSPSTMRAICNKGLGLPWYGFSRFSRDLANVDFCMDLKKSGCIMLKLGLESGDQRVLDSMQKGIDLETSSLVLRTLKKAGIAVYAYLMFGTPAESKEEALRTLEFTVKHSEYIDFLNLAIFNMPVCLAEKSGLETSKFYEGDLSLYTDFAHPAGWGRKEVRLFLEAEFKRHPAIAAILKKDPPVFTSNHAPFFLNQV